MNLDANDLTLEQQASLLSGRDFWSTKALPEHGIRSIVLTDGPHGVRLQGGQADHLGINDSVQATCYPPAVAIGSTWNPAAARTMGAALAAEASALGVHVLLGPGINIKRSPLCGRNFEYYSEDPYLSGVLGRDFVIALQAGGVGASVKHFAVNNQESDRMRVSADVDERALREIYLSAFERVVTEAQPATVMCSYNKINGVTASENRWLLTETLRDEWGFDGTVVSDWGAVSDRVAGVRAGMDLEMPGSGGGTDQQIVDAVRAGDLDADAVRASAQRLIRLSAGAHENAAPLDVERGHEIATELAEDAAVLLRNEGGTLPIDQYRAVAVVGGFAASPRYQGGGSSHINPTRVDSALDAIRAHGSRRDQQITYAEGFAADGSADDTGTLLTAAVAAAHDADVAVVFAGLPENAESEGFDRDHIDLPGDQIAVIRAVAAAATRTVVVLSHGGVVALEPWHDDVDAILDGFLLGQATGTALANLLYGDANPSGHLAETIPMRLEDTASFLNFPGEQSHVRYGEGVMVGYRHHSTLRQRVRYPFGHGLSYTEFRTDELRVEVTGPDTATVTVTATNTGQRPGKHVVQVYVATTAGPVRRPIRELRAFDKIDLEVGQTRTVTFSLDRRAFAYWDVVDHAWTVAPGGYDVQVCADADTVIAGFAIDLDGDHRVVPLTLDSTVGEWFAHPAVGPALMQGMAASMTEEQQAQAAEQQDQLRMVESMPMRQFLSFTGDMFPPGALDALMELSRADLTTQAA